MGRRGPPPKPTAVKKMQGTLRKDRANPREPKPTVRGTRYHAPTWLSAEGREEWERLEQELRSLGVLSELDLAAFAAVCSAVGLAKIAEAELRDALARPRKGSRLVGIAFELGMARRCWREAVRLGAEFGLTPSSRSRVSGEGHAKMDELDERFFFGADKPGFLPK